VKVQVATPPVTVALAQDDGSGTLPFGPITENATFPVSGVGLTVALRVMGDPLCGLAGNPMDNEVGSSALRAVEPVADTKFESPL
jgi:hypothetical protein